ncbi:STAS/SEC14 domain-containing protein [Sphingomonas sp. HDW15A]|uniref:STAS/SEC14 domain-containing protein n=1 Tax=Sphingomonas sp. HDW15A TaxID=2714942 RepID=UPI00140AF69B|nr:STAS/SEC14 domain-containing protein [Sphingomonas sp. HDW15A]QIK96277.1 STAS/SEC14 domain-containing protein [Sphingomonas sp. HDW15A]
MHEIIQSPSDVVAVKISGKITLDDLKAIMDRLDEVMAEHEKVHVFAETQGIEGVELSALPEHMRRAFPLFSQLNRFGRVAVVADQAWIRAGTRLESAMLPNISYRTYMPEEREEALGWVCGPAMAAAN